MNKISCSVIRDLMVLYEDDVCSEDSRQLIEEHISSCAECHHLYEQAKKVIPPITLADTENPKDAAKDAIDEEKERITRALQKLEKRITYKHIIVAGCLILFLLAGHMLWTEFLSYHINVAPADDIQITELYELESGDIFCSLKCRNVFTHLRLSDMLVPEQMGRKNCDEGEYQVHIQYPLPFENRLNKLVFGDTVSIVFPKEYTDSSTSSWTADEAGISHPDNPYTHTCSSIYYIGKGNNDRLLIWEEGQTLKKAPENIERLVEENSSTLDDCSELSCNTRRSPYWIDRFNNE